LRVSAEQNQIENSNFEIDSSLLHETTASGRVTLEGSAVPAYPSAVHEKH
jgi:hypothetical protein